MFKMLFPPKFPDIQIQSKNILTPPEILTALKEKHYQVILIKHSSPLPVPDVIGPWLIKETAIGQNLGRDNGQPGRRSAL